MNMLSLAFQREVNELLGKVPKTRGALKNLLKNGLVLLQAEKLEPAILRLAAAARLSEHLLGHAHPDTLDVQESLASVLHDLGDLDSARVLYEQVLNLRERLFGPEYPNTVVSRHNLANVLFEDRKSVV